jgi:thymidylate synthase
VTGLEAGEFVHTLGDAHLYLNHIEQAKTQIARAPHSFPTVRLAPRESLFDFVPEDVVLENYKAHPLIRAPIAV